MSSKKRVVMINPFLFMKSVLFETFVVTPSYLRMITDIEKNYVFLQPELATIINKSQVSVTLTNSSAVDPNMSGSLDYHKVRIRTNSTNWLSFTPDNGIININDSAEININFLGENLITGKYDGTINLISNDTTNSAIIIPVDLTINGYPEITLSDTLIFFDSTMQWTKAIDTLLVTNTGCDTLKISSISHSNSVFTLSYETLILLPGNMVLRSTARAGTAGSPLLRWSV